MSDDITAAARAVLAECEGMTEGPFSFVTGSFGEAIMVGGGGFAVEADGPDARALVALANGRGVIAALVAEVERRRERTEAPPAEDVEALARELYATQIAADRGDDPALHRRWWTERLDGPQLDEAREIWRRQARLLLAGQASEMTRLRQENERLRVALKPFAAEASQEPFCNGLADGVVVVSSIVSAPRASGLLLSDFRRALTTLNGEAPDA